MLGNASAQEWGALGERIASHPGTERDELDRLQLSANSGKAVLERVPAPVPPTATLFLGVISGDVKRRRCPAPTLPCARRASHTAHRALAKPDPDPEPEPEPERAPCTAAIVGPFACAQGDGSFDARGGASLRGSGLP